MGNQKSQLNDKLNDSYVRPSVTSTTIETRSSRPSLVSAYSRSTAPVTPISNYKYSSFDPSLKSDWSNGITGIYISENVAKIVVDFWTENIDILSMQDQLELGCSIFFGMAANDKGCKKIFKSKLNNDQLKIEHLSLKFLDNFAYLTRNLLRKDVNLYSSLSSLSVTHKSMGIKMKQFRSMLNSIHETFEYYLPKQYTPQVKYAMDKVFTVTAKIILQERLNKIRTEHSKSDDFSFLDSLDICLTSSVGRAYLFSYLQMRSCGNIIRFFELLSKLELQTTDKEKYVVARDIVKQCFIPDAVNYTVSNANVQQILESMQRMEKSYLMQQYFMFESNFFANAESDVYKSIMTNYWNDFVVYVKRTIMKNIMKNIV